ncbi:MAG: ABC transporter ATP-binding protein [Anaerolineae bacterium]|nr:ABC transporter ATP-binding protein [Anaerolineae bacterium]
MLARLGAMVEGASFYPFLSAWDNLAVLARTLGHYNPARLHHLLGLLGLGEVAHAPLVRGFSTGMKQRLGLAAALLHDPDIIVLDEPTNGLDPQGIHAFRAFVRRLVDEQGKTVFFSSHLLNEVQQLCDRVAIIQKGQLLAEGPLAELLGRYAANRYLIEATPIERALAVLQAHVPVHPYAQQGSTLVVQADRAQVPELARLLTEASISIYSIQPQNRTLEDLFLTITRNTQEPPLDEPDLAALSG